MHMLSPGVNKRLNELMGFLWFVAAIVIGLSLLSYSPLDPSFNTAVAAPHGRPPAENWIGIVGAHVADVLLQALGWVAFGLPVLLLALAVKWFRSLAVESPAARIGGVLLLLFSLTSLLALIPAAPATFGLLAPGGALGALLALGLTYVLNTPGAYIISFSALIVGAYLLVPFSLRDSTERVGQGAGAVATRAYEQRGRLAAAWAWLRVPLGRKPAPVDIPTILKRATLAEPAIARGLASKPPKAQPVPEDEWDEAASGPVLVKAKVEKVEEEEGEEPAPRRGARPVPVARQRYRLPSTALLRPAEHVRAPNEQELQERAEMLRRKLEEFDVRGQVVQINPGPVVTTFEFRPEAGVKISRITNLAEDLCLGLRADSILIERIAGKSTVGIEVPNPHRETIALRDIIEAQDFAGSGSKLTIALGKDLHGRTRVADLSQMPHLLIAGSTGAGKSVAINSFLISMLYKAMPDEVNFILIDPKRLELGLYDNIPHLYTPIVTDTKLAANALRNATREMERRLKLLARLGVRSLEQYNRLFADESVKPGLDENGDEVGPMPYLVIVIDELADLMLVDTPNVEESITRLAQMARAVGIHLILATQRPSVDVITGLIKANFPARLSFRVATKVDSRTILDSNGAEALLGKGDMLHLPAGSARLHRIHGPLVTESEIVHVCDFWRSQDKPQYHEDFLRFAKEPEKEAADEAVEVD
ncbi:MAG: DNA translocase FtsK, partial [Candidatus Acidiferrales bacterium]